MIGVVAAVPKLRLRDVRTELGLTQEKLANLAGLSKPVIIRAEAGNPFRALSAQAILKALNKIRAAQGESRLTIDDLDWNIDGD
jgi:predicted transcriptional regulator